MRGTLERRVGRGKDTKMNVIKITIEGPVQSGKSAVLQSIKGMLESFNYCVAIPNREERRNPSACISSAAPHEKPRQDKTVIVLAEKLSA